MELIKIYDNLLSGKIDCEKASEMMNSPEIQKMINAYLNKNMINKLIPFSEEDMQNIYYIVNICMYIYTNSGCDTGLTDSEYDELYHIMDDYNDGDIITSPLPTSVNNIEYHKYPALRGTLTKTYYLTRDEDRKNPSRRYLDEWKNSMETKIFNNSGKKIDLDNEEIYVFPKFDGVSGIFELNEFGEIDRVLTRGYTETNEAQNITHIFKNIPKRNYNEFGKVEYGLKTEIMMLEKNLEYFNDKYNTNYKNSRSIVSAILNSDEYDVEKSSLLHIVPLRVGDKNGNQELATEVFEKYPYLRCRLKDREAIRKFANENKYVHGGLRTDGAVIYIINPEIQKILGRENNKNNYEVAYKFTEESTFSKIEDITFTMGLFGRLTPVAQIKPVKLKGNTIENISLGSVGRIKELKLRKGDKVKVLYDIVPYLVFDEECKHNKDNDIIEIPDRCPECGEKLEFSESMEIASCINKQCPCRIKGKILNYLNKMNIDGISYAIINKLYDCGFVKSIKDLYKIKDNAGEISKLERFGAKSVTNWINSINSHRDVQDYIMLGALGIEDVSKRTFEKILSNMTINELLDISKERKLSELVKIPGIQDKTANKIIDGILDNKKLIKFLINELNIIDSKGNKNKGAFSVCFTKIRNENKERYILYNGGTISDSVTKDTTFLVVPSLDTQSSKVDKAKKYNIPIILIDDLEENINRYLDKIN